MSEPTVIIVMGVAGCGKTTIGKRLADRLGAAFEEGDAYHDAANVEKMRAGTPLSDADRAPWLARLSAMIDDRLAEGRRTVLACSALKAAYRDVLIGERDGVALVHLTGDETLIRSRLEARHNHYMPPTLLTSQLATLEPPKRGFAVAIDAIPDAIVSEIER
ncbi:MAG: gluconokinase, partial [Alphaproteobacteria bacterium]|nr:gluconokinase [Alphaproteobacteria bacterium]